MSRDKSKAIQIADKLLPELSTILRIDAEAAGDELRRLDAVNRELLETLIMVRDADDDAIMDCISRMPELARAKVDAAIAKATDV